MIKCDSSGCSDFAEVNISWPITIGNDMVRSSGNFCGSCGAFAWEKISRNLHCVSGAICSDPIKQEYKKYLMKHNPLDISLDI